MVLDFFFSLLTLPIMDISTIEQIIPELRAALIGRRFGKVFPMSRFSMAIDLRLTDSLYLFISVEPANPRIYLIRRRLRDLEKTSINPSPLVMQIRKRLAGADIVEIEQVPDERVVRIAAKGTDELGETFDAGLVVQLTGKSANLFLTDAKSVIIDSLRETLGDGQQTGDIYQPPPRPNTGKSTRGAHTVHGAHARPLPSGSLSQALDAADLEQKAEAEFRSAATAARTKIDREIAKLEKLRKRLGKDLESHGDAESWKRKGDLLLANAATAKRDGPKVEVIDYFDESVPTVGIEIDENDSLTEAAEKFFKRYTKARNAGEEIEKRIDAIETALEQARAEKAAVESEIKEADIDALKHRGGSTVAKAREKKEKGSAVSSVARIFLSSDGFEILVGKRAKDNDQLTFKIAKSLDMWMHAADYPGSHVVIRNRDRREIPPATLLEGAQLAAFYSQGKAQPKAAVHYTQKKFVNKPRGAAAGLVSLASFKTLLVEPVFPNSVTKKE